MIMGALRPHSVSSGCTDTQFDCTPQSPQPSQTSSVDDHALVGSGNWPRLRRRRFSAAQRLVVDQYRKARNVGKRESARQSGRRGDGSWTPFGKSASRGYFHGSSVTRRSSGASAANLPGDLRNAQAAVLAVRGHRTGVVEQDL